MVTVGLRAVAMASVGETDASEVDRQRDGDQERAKHSILLVALNSSC